MASHKLTLTLTKLCSFSNFLFCQLAGYDPCIDHYTETYLNNLEVQAALHARINTSWSGCT